MNNNLQFIYDVKELIAACGGYEPYYRQFDEEDYIKQYTYYQNNKLVGLVSCLNSDPAVITPTYNEYGVPVYEIEFTGCVMPGYRRMGIFETLFAEMCRELHFLFNSTLNTPNYEIHFTTSLTDAMYSSLSTSSLSPQLIYSEMLMYKDTIMRHEYEELSNRINENKLDDLYDYTFYDNDTLFNIFEKGSNYPFGQIELSFDHNTCCIYNVLIDESKRGLGLSNHMMDIFLKEYGNRYEQPLILQVSSTNLAAVALYQRCDFRVKESVNYYSINAKY